MMRTGVVRARQNVRRFMTTPIAIMRGEATIFTGRCSFESAEANQGQAAHMDAVEANQKALHSYDLWLPWTPEARSVAEGDLALLTPPEGDLALSVIATEAAATHKVAVQLRGAVHRLSTPVEGFAFVRIDDAGGETIHGPYLGQMILEGPTPIGQGQVVTGGVVQYLHGSIFLKDRQADVEIGDRFAYGGKFGEVIGLPGVQADRLQVKIRLPDGAFD